MIQMCHMGKCRYLGSVESIPRFLYFSSKKIILYFYSFFKFWANPLTQGRSNRTYHFWRLIAADYLKCHFFNILRVGNLFVGFFAIDVPLKNHFISALLGQSQGIQKVVTLDHPIVRACPDKFSFLFSPVLSISRQFRGTGMPRTLFSIPR